MMIKSYTASNLPNTNLKSVLDHRREQSKTHTDILKTKTQKFCRKSEFWTFCKLSILYIRKLQNILRFGEGFEIIFSCTSDWAQSYFTESAASSL